MKKTHYVYYDNKTGMIESITKVKLKTTSPYIECELNDVIGFLDGSLNIMLYVVAYKKDEDKHLIMKKENIIKLRQESKKLYKIPNKRSETEVKLIYHPDNVLEIKFFMELITPLYTTLFGKEVEFEKGTELRIFVNDKKTGEVYKEVIIDAQKLLEKGSMFIRLPDECFTKNVTFYTYKLLNSYSWEVGKHKLSSPILEGIKYNIHKADTKRKEGFDYHLEMKPTENTLVIKNNIEDLQLARVHGYLEFFITDYSDPHILFGKFSITEEMLKNKHFSISLDEKFDLDKQALLYNHKYISVLLERP